MSKIIRLTESELVDLVKKVIQEQTNPVAQPTRVTNTKTNAKFEELCSILFKARDSSWADNYKKAILNNKFEIKHFGAAIVNWAMKHRGIDEKVLKAIITFIFRESKGTMASHVLPKEIGGAILNLFGGNHSQGYAQIQPDTAKKYGIDMESLYSFEGSLDAVYKMFSTNYQKAKQYYKGNTVTIFENGKLKQIPAFTEDAAFHIAIAAHNAGEGIINQWCETNMRGVANLCSVKQRQVYDDNPKSIAVTNPSKKIPNYFPNISNVHDYIPQFATCYNILAPIPTLIPQSIVTEPSLTDLIPKSLSSILPKSLASK
jgi:hypothetical protein